MSAIITRTQWAAENLPAGLTMSSGGIITGKPTVEGSYDVPVTVNTNWGTATKNIHISVEKQIKWTARGIINYNNNARLYSKGYIDIIDNLPLFAAIDVNSNLYFNYVYRIDTDEKDDDSIIVSPIKSAGIATTANNYYSNVYGFVKCKYYSDRIYILGSKSHSNRYIHYLTESSTFPGSDGSISSSTISSSIASSITPRAGCIDNNWDVLIFFSSKVIKIPYNSTSLDTTAYSVGVIPNYRCAACNTQSGVICVTSSNGIRVTTGYGNTWVSATTSPNDNLLELTYREDLNKFFAVGESTGLFYVSEDGLNWEQFNNTPVPLTTVKSMSYNASAGYCVIGTAADGTDKHTYHSMDGENWTEAILPFNDNAYTVISVAYSPNFECFFIKASYTRHLYTLSKTDLWGNQDS